MNPNTRTSPSYLIRNPYSYCFRMFVPKDLQQYIGKKELRYSLRTGYLGLAKLKARYVAGHVQSIFRLLRKGALIMTNLSDDQIKELVNKYIKDSLEGINSLFNDEQEDDFQLFTNEPQFYGYLSELEGIRQDLIANLNMGKFVMLENAICDFLQEQGSDRVFPELKKENYKYSHGLSKSFGRYLRNKVKIEDKKKTFHSFRHNVTDYLMKNLVKEYLVEELNGRSGKTESSRTYFKGHRSDVLYKECISKLEYKVDLSHLKNSKYVLK